MTEAQGEGGRWDSVEVIGARGSSLGAQWWSFGLRGLIWGH